MDKRLEETLAKAVELSKDYDELTALYIIDLNQTKIRQNIFNQSHKKEIFLKYMKKIYHLIKEDDFDVLVVDMNERIACKKIDQSIVVVLVADKEMSYGKIFALLRSIAS